MAVIASRPPGDKPGADIIESILTTDLSQRERGRQEINFHSTDRVIESGNLIGTDFVRPGNIVQVSNLRETFKAKITVFAFTINHNGDYNESSSIESERIK